MTKTKQRPMGKKRFLDILAKRLFAYALLKRTFIEEPSEKLLTLLMDENLIDAFPFQEENQQIKEGVQMVAFYLKDPDALSAQGIENLIVDFSGLFIAPGKQFTKPWESVYISKKKLFFQPETIAVRNEYAKVGLLPERFRLEPDDHISLELDFMAVLCDWSLKSFRKNELRKVRKYLETQKRFIEEHFAKWIPQLANQIGEKAETDFYRGMGKLLIGYLTLERTMVDDLIKQVKLRIAAEKDKKRALTAVQHA